LVNLNPKIAPTLWLLEGLRNGEMEKTIDEYGKLEKQGNMHYPKLPRVYLIRNLVALGHILLYNLLHP
jgi:hypothetical protein